MQKLEPEKDVAMRALDSCSSRPGADRPIWLIASVLLLLVPLLSRAESPDLETAVEPAYLYEASAPNRGLEAIVWSKREGVLSDSLELVGPTRVQQVPSYANDFIYPAIARAGRFRIRLQPKGPGTRLRVEQSVLAWSFIAGQQSFTEMMKSSKRGPWRALSEIEPYVFELLPGGEIRPDNSRDALVSALVLEGSSREVATQIISGCGDVYTCDVLMRVDLRVSIVDSSGTETEVGTVVIFASQLM